MFIDKLIKQNAMVLKLTWGALLFSTFIYSFVGYKVLAQGDGSEGVDDLTLLYAFSGASVLCALLSFKLGNFLENSALSKLKKSQFKVSPAATPAQLAALGGLDEKGQQASLFLGRLTAAYLTRWILCEAIAIFGLVLVQLSRNIQVMIPFVLVSWILFFLHRPKSASEFKNLISVAQRSV